MDKAHELRYDHDNASWYVAFFSLFQDKPVDWLVFDLSLCHAHKVLNSAHDFTHCQK